MNQTIWHVTKVIRRYSASSSNIERDRFTAWRKTSHGSDQRFLGCYHNSNDCHTSFATTLFFPLHFVSKLVGDGSGMFYNVQMMNEVNIIACCTRYADSSWRFPKDQFCSNNRISHELWELVSKRLDVASQRSTILPAYWHGTSFSAFASSLPRKYVPYEIH